MRHKNTIPPAVRILPMSRDEFDHNKYPLIPDVQQKYFLQELHHNDGRYYCHKTLNATPGTAVLFQFDNSIIATATLSSPKPYMPTKDYKCCLFFDVTSIQIFDPVDSANIRRIWPTVKQFGRVQWKLSPKSYARFRQLLNIRTPQPAARPPQAIDFATPPKRYLATEYRIIRDTDLAREVKRHHDYKCQICGRTILLPNGERYAESHHIQPLGHPHDGPDQRDNILCVCPNHHAELDYGVLQISPALSRHALQHSVAQKYIDYHNKIIFGVSSRSPRVQRL